MFKGDNKGMEKAEDIAKDLADHKKYLSHGRPIRLSDAQRMGVKVVDLRDNKDLRNKVWELYCIMEILFDRSPAIKIYENSKGVFLVKNVPFQMIPMQQMPQEQSIDKK